MCSSHLKRIQRIAGCLLFRSSLFGFALYHCRVSSFSIVACWVFHSFIVIVVIYTKFFVQPIFIETQTLRFGANIKAGEFGVFSVFSGFRIHNVKSSLFLCRKSTYCLLTHPSVVSLSFFQPYLMFPSHSCHVRVRSAETHMIIGTVSVLCLSSVGFVEIPIDSWSIYFVPYQWVSAFFFWFFFCFFNRILPQFDSAVIAMCILCLLCLLDFFFCNTSCLIVSKFLCS